MRVRCLARVLAVALAITTVVVFVGSVGFSAEPTVVTVWSWRRQDPPLWEAVEARLRQMGENIRIEHRPILGTQYDAVLATAMQGGQGPDIIVSRPTTGCWTYAAAGQFEPLAGKVDFSRFSRAILDTVSYRGVPYAVPFAVQTMHVYYNKDIYKQLGLKVPNTWDEFIANLKATKAAGYVPLFLSGRAGWTLPLYVYAIGATWLGNDWVRQVVETREKDFTDRRFVEVLKRIQDLTPYFQKDFMASNYQDMGIAFTTGVAAHVVDGIWRHTEFQSTNPALNMGLFLVPGATAAVQKRVYASGDGGYAVNSASKVKEAALKVVKIMATLEGGQIFVETVREPSAVVGVKPPADPLLQQALNEYASVALSPSLQVLEPPPSSERQAVEELRGFGSLVTEAVEGMLTGKLTAEQAAAKVNDGLSWFFKKR